MPETFSSEIGDVHERRGDRDSFTDEFRGASESVIEYERPPRPIEVGRRGRRMMWTILLVTALVGGGGWALWYWSTPLGEWIAGWGVDEDERDEDEAEAGGGEAEAGEADVEAEPSPADEPPRAFGVKGAPPEPGAAEAEEGRADPEPASGEPGEAASAGQPPPEPSAPAEASVEIASTKVRGRVSSARVESRLEGADEALKGCWAKAAAKPGVTRPVELSLSFRIKWNGRALGVSVEGEVPEPVRSCVREALPSGGWPQPSDGGDAYVTRIWKLE